MLFQVFCYIFKIFIRQVWKPVITHKKKPVIEGFFRTVYIEIKF